MPAPDQPCYKYFKVLANLDKDTADYIEKLALATKQCADHYELIREQTRNSTVKEAWPYWNYVYILSGVALAALLVFGVWKLVPLMVRNDHAPPALAAIQGLG